MVVADEDITVHLAAEVAVVFHTSHRITVSDAGCVQVVLEALVTSFISESSLDIEAVNDVISDGSAESVTVTVYDRFFPVQHPVRVLELLHCGVCPVVYVHSS